MAGISRVSVFSSKDQWLGSGVSRWTALYYVGTGSTFFAVLTERSS